MLDKFRDDSSAFFRGNDDHEAYTEMMNSGLLILTRAYHANKGYETPEPSDIGAVSTVLNWMIRQDMDEINDQTYADKAAHIAQELYRKGGLNIEERDDFTAFARLCRENTYTLNHGANGQSYNDQPAQG